jgi:hypothetical protein
MMMAEREVGLKEAAALKDVNLRTLQAAAKSGALTARRVADVWVVRLSAVDRWVKQAQHRPGPPPGKGPKRRKETTDG